jgi:hypothetical protein
LRLIRKYSQTEVLYGHRRTICKLLSFLFFNLSSASKSASISASRNLAPFIADFHFFGCQIRFSRLSTLSGRFTIKACQLDASPQHQSRPTKAGNNVSFSMTTRRIISGRRAGEGYIVTLILTPEANQGCTWPIPRLDAINR